MKNKFKFLTLTLLTIVKFTYGQEKIENLKIVWPEEYKWKLGSNQENKNMQMLEIVPEKETIENWTILGTMVSIKGIKNASMEGVMNTTYDQAKTAAPKAKLTFIEKDDKAKNPWIIFKVEAPNFINDKNPESQLYYVVQGEQSLYSNFVAIKEKKLNDEFVAKWKKVFRNSEFVDHE